MKRDRVTSEIKVQQRAVKGFEKYTKKVNRVWRAGLDNTS